MKPRNVLVAILLLLQLHVLASCGVIACGFPDKTTRWDPTDDVAFKTVREWSRRDYEMDVSAPKIQDRKLAVMTFEAVRKDSVLQREVVERKFEKVEVHPPAPYGVEWWRHGGAKQWGLIGVLYVLPFEPFSFVLNAIFSG